MAQNEGAMAIFQGKLYLASGCIKNGLNHINKSHPKTSYAKEQSKA